MPSIPVVIRYAPNLVEGIFRDILNVFHSMAPHHGLEELLLCQAAQASLVQRVELG
eukprot:CAMPEP_0115767576 /NCGR_PEP_ID=MMETSP0272-20121206/103742_1 /TAXON_ID=71861 /ORGANISM="Scrippsiella trochoidea, Strain CCMP3099" /LENGTH=55 /DNA_ID=CAMNT_0003213589 /DNA_START=491 /DNA_END=658 /DNA_ORIENTATION=-